MEIPSTQPSTMDIRPASAHPMHHSRRFVIISSIVLVILATILIGLRIKAHRAYEAYLRTPLGQLQALRDASQPVTKTPQDRADDLAGLKKSSRPVTTSQQDQLNVLNALSQQ